MDNEKSVTDQFDSLFSGLESGLKSLREVRETYDEEVAFDFNPLQIIWPNENTVTELLIYFLNPEAKHGQKDRLLRVFLESIGAQKAVTLLEQGKPVKVSTQFYTDNRRPVDAVLTFGNYDYVIGIENKVNGAVDQQDQIKDYIEDLKNKVTKKGGTFLMLYLPPYGVDPSRDSIAPDQLAEYKGKEQFKVIPFCGSGGECTVLSILKALSGAARADSVRSFIKFMIKYFETRFRGGTTMAEQKYVNDYLTKHPDFFALIPTLFTGYEEIKRDLTWRYQLAIERILKNNEVGVPGWPIPGINDAVVYGKTELPNGCYFSIIEGCIGLYCQIDADAACGEDTLDAFVKAHNDFSPVKDFVKKMELKYSRQQSRYWRWLVLVPLPDIWLNDVLLIKILADRSDAPELSGILHKESEKVAKEICDFIETVEAEWKNADLPTKTSEGIL